MKYMKLEKILIEVGIHSYISYLEIYGGKDSKVFKVDVKPGETYALRLLPLIKLDQFINEKNMIEIAIDNRVPVPKVYKIVTYENYSVMLMEWGAGQTVFEELKRNPKNAVKLGYEFGRVQALINSIYLPSIENRDQTWLLPTLDEKRILDKIPQNSLKSNLIHLDYHPLNVLTDGEKITAVIDWANSTIGDYRYDISRTLSILQLEGVKHFQDNPGVIAKFEEGWRNGHEEVLGPLESLDYFSLFNAWSGLRMKRDLEDKITVDDGLKIQKWIMYWLNKLP